jgi:uncharacterized LabA/DUF88 family protein
MENNYAFIDSQNLNLAIRDQNWILDYSKFRRYLKEKYGIEKAYLFIGFIKKKKWLYQLLAKAGFNLVFKSIMVLKNGSVKGNVDAELVLHTMIQYSNFEKAIIITGDGDFACLIEYLREQNKLLKLLIPNSAKYSKFLRKAAADKIDFMNNLKNKLSYKNGRQLHKDRPL